MDAHDALDRPASPLRAPVAATDAKTSKPTSRPETTKPVDAFFHDILTQHAAPPALHDDAEDVDERLNRMSHTLESLITDARSVLSTPEPTDPELDADLLALRRLRQARARMLAEDRAERTFDDEAYTVSSFHSQPAPLARARPISSMSGSAITARRSVYGPSAFGGASAPPSTRSPSLRAMSMLAHTPLTPPPQRVLPVRASTIMGPPAVPPRYAAVSRPSSRPVSVAGYLSVEDPEDVVDDDYPGVAAAVEPRLPAYPMSRNSSEYGLDVVSEYSLTPSDSPSAGYFGARRPGFRPLQYAAPVSPPPPTMEELAYLPPPPPAVQQQLMYRSSTPVPLAPVFNEEPPTPHEAAEAAAVALLNAAPPRFLDSEPQLMIPGPESLLEAVPPGDPQPEPQPQPESSSAGFLGLGARAWTAVLGLMYLVLDTTTYLWAMFVLLTAFLGIKGLWRWVAELSDDIVELMVLDAPEPGKAERSTKKRESTATASSKRRKSTATNASSRKKAGGARRAQAPAPAA
ncbi:hypothetical protein GGF31_006080 [Allomyces arbusculus]|nr:hypothetical protein GGF31_006080 [Allomyces arbusculus]